MSGSRSRSWLQMLATVVLLLPAGPVRPAGAQAGPNLIIEHVDAATWAPTNNRFRPQSRECFWTGFAVQVGSFQVGLTDYVVDSLAVLDPTGVPLFHDPLDDDSAFLWIDIRGSWGNGADTCAPVLPEEAFWLFPNATAVDKCAQPGDVSKPGKVDVLCRRGRQLHPDMVQVRAVITYWQGEHGFSATSTQPDKSIDKRFEFLFHDDFIVDVWKLDATDPDPKRHRFTNVFTSGDVARIVVAAKKSEHIPIEGKTQEPPWWYP